VAGTRKRKQDYNENSEGSVCNYTMATTVRLAGVAAHRLRRYEEGGLITPARTEGNQRLYSEADINLIKQITLLEDEGINIEGIRAILEIRRGKRE